MQLFSTDTTKLKTWRNRAQKMLIVHNWIFPLLPWASFLKWSKLKIHIGNKDNILNYSIHFSFYKLDWIHNQPGFWLSSWKSRMRLIRIYDRKVVPTKGFASWMNQRLTNNTAQCPSQSSNRISIFLVNSFSWVVPINIGCTRKFL